MDDVLDSSEVLVKQHNGPSDETQPPTNGEVRNGHHEKKHKKHKHHKHDKDKDRDRKREKDRQHSSTSDREKGKDSVDSSPHKSTHSSPEKHIKLEKKDKDKSSSSEKRDKSSDKYNKINNMNSNVSSSSSPSKEITKDSGSSKHHKSKHKDKHREKDRDREKSGKSSSGSSHTKESSLSPEKLKLSSEVKAEPALPVKSFQLPIKTEDESDDDLPLSMRGKSQDMLTESILVPKKEKIKSEDEAKDEESSDDDIPLSERRKQTTNDTKKRKVEAESSDDDIPLNKRQSKKIKTQKSSTKSRKRQRSDSEEDSEFESRTRKKSKSKSSESKRTSSSNSSNKDSPKKGGRKAKEEEPEEVWEWWKEDRRNDGFKWRTLEHKGPVFAPDYERLPKNVNLRYGGKVVHLSEEAEEVAGFYSRFIEHDYTTKPKFNENFFKDWRKVMTKSEKELITDLSKCDFKDINDYYKKKSEERKAMSKEEKQKIKAEKEAIQKEYGICIVDGHKEKIGNFNIEPPGLFRGRGEHPKMGMLKKRVRPEDVIINCSKNSKFPEPPKGHRWKEIRHDNEVSWLANWTENVQNQGKYVMLNPTSRLKGEKDWLKYEKARELSKHIEKIRSSYRDEFHSKEMRVRQRAVAMYFIDKLALRAGNEKDEEQADTVGCCSLRFEHIKLHDTLKDKSNVVVFDFLGKDSIRYHNVVEVEKRVFKNLKLFMDHKKPGDDLFDRLNTGLLNKHLSELMDGLSAKVFRTYNASHTLQQQLDEMTPKHGTVAEKLLAYNRANRAVAVLCNHQRAVPKSHEKSMENLDNKIETKRDEVKALKKEVKGLKKGSKDHEKKNTSLKRLEEQLAKLEMDRTDKDEGKDIALGTSKLNYLDPRISVAWCKKWDVPYEKVYNKTQRAKFRWAIDMADKHFKFD